MARRFDEFLRHFLHVEANELRLKWVFDHVRNYGLAALVMAAGLCLSRNGSLVATWPGGGMIVGIVLLIVGFFLLVLNLVHAIWAMVQLKARAVPYFAISSILFLAAIELTAVLVQWRTIR